MNEMLPRMLREKVVELKQYEPTAPEEIERYDMHDFHAVTEGFEKAGYPLSDELESRLGEDEQHQGNREGSGFTQATKELARFINGKRTIRDINVLAPHIRHAIEELAHDSGLKGNEWRQLIDAEKIHETATNFKNEGDKLFAGMIENILLGSSSVDAPALKPLDNPNLRIGSCTTAELYFLSFLKDRGEMVGWTGHMNVITDESGDPVILEKISLGESHSAITLKPTILNEVTLPAGSLLAVEYDYDNYKGSRTQSANIPLSECTGFRFLRLTTLAVSPENRKETFKNHYDFQDQNGMPHFDTATIENFLTLARQKIAQ